MTWRSGKLYWKNKDFSPEDLIDYYELPYEVEAHGRQRGLFLAFISVWDDFVKREMEKV